MPEVCILLVPTKRNVDYDDDDDSNIILLQYE
jgi:hypothetical protein